MVGERGDKDLEMWRRRGKGGGNEEEEDGHEEWLADVIELGGGGEAVSHGSSQCTQETDKHIRCGCGSALRTRRNGLAALISEGNAYALLTLVMSPVYKTCL